MNLMQTTVFPKIYFMTVLCSDKPAPTNCVLRDKLSRNCDGLCLFASCNRFVCNQFVLSKEKVREKRLKF